MDANQQPMSDELAACAAQIEARIASAFADVHAPPYGLIDGDPRDPEREEVREKLEGRDWRELSVADALDLVGSIWCLNIEGRLFLLPGFMTASLHSFRAPRTGAWPNLPVLLLPWLSPEMGRLSPLIEAMSTAQAAVTLEFIRWAAAATQTTTLEEQTIAHWERAVRSKQAADSASEQGDP